MQCSVCLSSTGLPPVFSHHPASQTMAHPAGDGILLEMKKCNKIHIFRAAYVKKWHPRRLYVPALNAAGGRDAVFSNTYINAQARILCPARILSNNPLNM